MLRGGLTDEKEALKHASLDRCHRRGCNVDRDRCRQSGLLICRGKTIAIDLVDGGAIDPPASHGLLHDPSGRLFPKRSLLIGPFERGSPADEETIPREAGDYLGRAYEVRRRECRLSPKELSAWKRVGEVATLGNAQGEIFYTRGGTRAPGRFRHKFNKASLSRLFRGRGKVTLYSC